VNVKTLRARLVVPVLAAAGLAGCARAPEGDALFPLDAGRQWTYRVTTAWEGEVTERETLTLRALGADRPEGLPDEPPAWHRRSDSGVDYWLRSDASGIYRVASKSDLEAEAQRDPAPRYVLKAPYEPGTQWQAPTTAYVLARTSEFPRELRHTHRNIPMAYRIESTGQGLDTPAGRFEGCLKVVGTASVRVYADPTAGWRDLPLTTTEWYCAGVGLARLERTEPANSPFLTGGSLTMELESWQ